MSSGEGRSSGYDPWLPEQGYIGQGSREPVSDHASCNAERFDWFQTSLLLILVIMALVDIFLIMTQLTMT